MQTVHRTSHASHAQTFLALGSSVQAAFSVCCLETFILASVCRVSHVDPAPFSSTLSIPTFLFSCPSDRTNPCATPQGLLFGRMAEQSPLTGYEPNAPVEVNSAEFTPTLVPSRKGSIGSTFNSGEDIATTPAVSEVDGRSDLGMLASPLLSQERETSANPLGIYHSNRECSETRSSHVRTISEKPVAMCSNKRKSSRELIFR